MVRESSKDGVPEDCVAFVRTVVKERDRIAQACGLSGEGEEFGEGRSMVSEASCDELCVDLLDVS